jgi:hypothetical protein
LPPDSANLHAAMKSPQAEDLVRAYDAELDALIAANTIVQVPKTDILFNTPVVRSVTVFKTKLDANGRVARCKERINLNAQQ